MDVEGVLKHSQKHFTSPLVPLVLDANADPLSITTIIAKIQAMEASGQVSAVMNGGADIEDWSISNLTITPLGSYVLLTDELYKSMNSGDLSKIQQARIAASTEMDPLVQLVRALGLGAFVPVTTAGLGYDLAVCSEAHTAEWVLWLASKPAPAPSVSDAPTNAMIYTLGSYNIITEMCTSTSLQIVGATASWLKLWIGVALGLAAAGAIGASLGNAWQGIDFVAMMAGPGGPYGKLTSARDAIPLGGSFMGGVGLAAASIFHGGPLGPEPPTGAGFMIWNLDPNNDFKITAPYFDNAHVPGGESLKATTWQDTTIPKAIPAGGVWTPEGFNPTTALTTACCIEEFLFLVSNWVENNAMGVAMCAVRGADSTGVGLKFQSPVAAFNKMGMQASIAPNGPAVEAFYNDSSSFSKVQQQKISVPAGYDVLGGSSMTLGGPVWELTFLLGLTP